MLIKQLGKYNPNKHVVLLFLKLKKGPLKFMISSFCFKSICLISSNRQNHKSDNQNTSLVLIDHLSDKLRITRKYSWHSHCCTGCWKCISKIKEPTKYIYKNMLLKCVIDHSYIVFCNLIMHHHQTLLKYTVFNSDALWVCVCGGGVVPVGGVGVWVCLVQSCHCRGKKLLQLYMILCNWFIYFFWMRI